MFRNIYGRITSSDKAKFYMTFLNNNIIVLDSAVLYRTDDYNIICEAFTTPFVGSEWARVVANV